MLRGSGAPAPLLGAMVGNWDWPPRDIDHCTHCFARVPSDWKTDVKHRPGLKVWGCPAPDVSDGTRFLVALCWTKTGQNALCLSVFRIGYRIDYRLFYCCCCDLQCFLPRHSSHCYSSH